MKILNEKNLRLIIIISVVFTCMTAILLILNYLQISKSDPLENKALSVMVERLVDDPENHQLTEDIRQLDLLARKAYFNSQWQIKTGAVLLLAGAIVLIFSLRVFNKYSFIIEEPGKGKPDQAKVRHKTQVWISVAAIILLISGGLSAMLSINRLDKYNLAVATEVVSGTDESDIEKIEIPGNDSIAMSDSLAQDSLTMADSTLLEEEVIPLNETTIKQQHNSFRGAFGNGVSTSRNIPTDWNTKTGKNIVWKTPIPISGKNSPIVWGEKVFISGATANKRVVYCLDKNTGSILWEKTADKISGSPAASPKTTDDTGLAAPSLTVDGQRVFALFGNGDLIAFNFKGDRVWAKNLGVPDNHYGHSSSLITWSGKLFIQYDTHSGCKVMAINTADGKTIWSTARTNDVSWSSPILAKISGKMQLILQANPNVAGYDISNGKQLWSVDCMTGEVGPSPAYGGGFIYAANEYAKLVAIDPKAGSIVWESMDKLPEVSSPVFHNGLLFTATTYAVLACFDAATGQLNWEHEAATGFYSSPVIADNKLYIFDTNGKAYIFSPGTKAQLISSPELGEKVFSTPSFSDGRMYVRGSKNLYCIGKK